MFKDPPPPDNRDLAGDVQIVRLCGEARFHGRFVGVNVGGPHGAGRLLCRQLGWTVGIWLLKGQTERYRRAFHGYSPLSGDGSAAKNTRLANGSQLISADTSN